MVLITECARCLCVAYLQAYLRQLKLMQTIYAALSKMLVQWSANVTAIYPEAPPPYKA